MGERVSLLGERVSLPAEWVSRGGPTRQAATSFYGWGSGLVGESRETKAVEQSKWRAGSCSLLSFRRLLCRFVALRPRAIRSTGPVPKNS